MKTIFILIAGVILVFNCNAQVLDCKKFKTGTFYYPEIEDHGYTIREKNIQKSYYPNNNMIVTWKVNWTSDCTFELTFDEVQNGDSFFKKGDKIIATITAIEGDCYTFSSRFYNSDNPDGQIAPPGQMCLKKE